MHFGRETYVICQNSYLWKTKKRPARPASQNFERKVNELVKEGEAPDAEQRAKKEAEVKAAFDEHGKPEK